MACRASCVPLPLTHPDEHPWVSGCTALPTHPRSRSSSRQEGVGQSPPFSTLTAPIWFGESRVRGAKYLPRIWLSCSWCCGWSTPGGTGDTDCQCVPGCYWLSPVAGLSQAVTAYGRAVDPRTRGRGNFGLPCELPCCPDPQERWPRGPTQKSQTTEIFALAAV